MFVKKVRKAELAVAERKNVDSAQATTINTVGTIFSLGLDGLPQGTQMINRLGNEISLRSLNIRGELLTGDPTNQVRLVLIQWLSETASLTVMNNVIFNNALGGFTYLSSYAKEYAGKFKVLGDKLISLNTVSTPNKIFRFSVRRFASNVIRYNSQVAGNLVTKGGLFLLALSDSNVIPNVAISFESRITFVDT